jgi:hypothetical protein
VIVEDGRTVEYVHQQSAQQAGAPLLTGNGGSGQLDHDGEQTVVILVNGS